MEVEWSLCEQECKSSLQDSRTPKGTKIIDKGAIGMAFFSGTRPRLKKKKMIAFERMMLLNVCVCVCIQSHMYIGCNCFCKEKRASCAEETRSENCV